jgi:heptosyltransferase-2
VWRVVHDNRYDAVIDMRSTVNTMLFALFSLRSPLRIGIRKPYTWGVFNRRYEGCEDDENMIDHNLRLAEPLSTGHGAWKEVRNLTLCITGEEQRAFRQYMQQQGVDFSRPVMLVGVTAKLPDKTWAEERMTETLRRLMARFPDLQLIFNYAPGQEADNAHRIYETLGCPPQVFVDVEARSARQLAAMAANCTAYFGNEGGGRHIVQAMGRPSLVVCSPGASKTTWLPQATDVAAWGVAAADLADVTGMTRTQQYDLLTVDAVWPLLERFCREVIDLQ